MLSCTEEGLALWPQVRRQLGPTSAADAWILSIALPAVKMETVIAGYLNISQIRSKSFWYHLSSITFFPLQDMIAAPGCSNIFCTDTEK